MLSVYSLLARMESHRLMWPFLKGRLENVAGEVGQCHTILQCQIMSSEMKQELWVREQ